MEYPGQIIRLLQQFSVALSDNNELHVAIRLNTFGCESLVNNNLILSSVHTNGHPVCLEGILHQAPKTTYKCLVLEIKGL